MRKREKVVRWTQKTRAGGQSTPALTAATLSGCLSSVWCGQSLTRCRMVSDSWRSQSQVSSCWMANLFEVCSIVSMALEELCDLVIQLDPIHPGSVSHIQEIFVGVFFPLEDSPTFHSMRSWLHQHWRTGLWLCPFHRYHNLHGRTQLHQRENSFGFENRSGWLIALEEGQLEDPC